MRDPMEVPTQRYVFREHLIARMKALQLTAAQLARMAGLSKDAISTYTTMRSVPTPQTLARLAKALKCKPQELLPDRPQLDYILELRECSIPGHKELVVKMPVPTEMALTQFRVLSEMQDARKAATNRDA